MGTFGGALILTISLLITCSLVLTILFYSTTNQFQPELSGLIILPLFISAFQNIYLGIVAYQIDQLALQIFLMLHWVWAIVILAGILIVDVNKPKGDFGYKVLLIFIAVILYAIALFAVYRGSPISMFSSFRNLSTPLLFFSLGYFVTRYVRLEVFLFYLRGIGWFIVIFGFVEYLFDRQVWPLLNIDMLWIKKGITNLASWGFPENFVSSEKFFGKQIRRMASSYADPVNFGAVIFLIVAVSWYAKKYFLMWAAVACCFLAISKGAFVGLLLLFVTRTFYYASKIKFAVISTISLAVGIGFLVYSAFHSTQSVAAHSEGLLAALRTLPSYPIGRGLGNVGVYSGGESEIKESGAGVIIGQLGIVGILLYGYFFLSIARKVFTVVDLRQRAFAVVLIGSILINITFNEVALSPNSAAGYFILLGIILGMTDIMHSSEKISTA